MWPSPDRCVEIIGTLIKKEERNKKEHTIHQAEKDFRETLKKLWPLKSNEKQS
jgi:hypothetical protein